MILIGVRMKKRRLPISRDSRIRIIEFLAGQVKRMAEEGAAKVMGRNFRMGEKGFIEVMSDSSVIIGLDCMESLSKDIAAYLSKCIRHYNFSAISVVGEDRLVEVCRICRRGRFGLNIVAESYFNMVRTAVFAHDDSLISEVICDDLWSYGVGV